MKQLTLQQLIRKAAQRLEGAGLRYGHGTDNAYDEAVWLVLHALGLSPVAPVANMDLHISADATGVVMALIEQRIVTRKPAAYLTGAAWFCAHEFYVDERVLVPRSPIAELIHELFSPWLLGSPERILDLCTGSGCIAVACAYAFPDAEVHAGDISVEALEVAAMNVARHSMLDRVVLYRSDLFTDIPVDEAHLYDLIVSNPPYVDAGEMAALDREYCHEPTLGLAAGEDGLLFVSCILRDAADYLHERGLLVVEVGNSDLALQKKYPQVPFIWMDFAMGGSGVFLLTGRDVHKYRSLFVEKCFAG